MKITDMAKEAILLPPKADLCQSCATKHHPSLPHNQQSMFWQCWFYKQNDRWPTWADAMAHCTDEMKKSWVDELARLGVQVEVQPS